MKMKSYFWSKNNITQLYHFYMFDIDFHKMVQIFQYKIFAGFCIFLHALMTWQIRGKCHNMNE